MENKTKKRTSLVAFAIGVIVGKKGIKIGTHILYLTLLLVTFFCAEHGPLNAYVTNLSSNKCKEEIKKEYEPKLLEAQKQNKALKAKIEELREAKNSYSAKYHQEQRNNINQIEKVTNIITKAIYYHTDYENNSPYIAVVKNVSENLVFYDTYKINNDNGITKSTQGLIRPLPVFKNRYRIDSPSTDRNLLKILKKIK